MRATIFRSRFFLLSWATETFQYMKRTLSALVGLLLTTAISAQQTSVSGEDTRTQEKIWTTAFSSVDIDAPIKATLHRIADHEAPYATVCCPETAARPTIEVDGKGTLTIKGRNSRRNTGIATIDIYHHALDRIEIERADVLLADTLSGHCLDIETGNGTHLRATVDAADLKLNVSGDCIVRLAGKTRYLSACVSASEADLSALTAMAVRIEAAHKARVGIHAAERLEASIEYGADIIYSGRPQIIRITRELFGGEFIAND